VDARAKPAHDDVALLRLDVGGAGDRDEILQVGADGGLKFRGAAARRREALLGKSGNQIGIAQRAVELAVEPHDDFAGRAGRGEQADPWIASKPG